MRHSARGFMITAAAVAVMLAVVACGDDEEAAHTPSVSAGAETGTPTATASPIDSVSPSPSLATFTPEPETSPTPVSGVDPGISQEFLRLIIDKDVERRPGQTNPVDDVGVTVIASEAMTWPDGCLGLTNPGMCYLPSQTVHGFRITLAVVGFEDRDTLTYHVSESESQPGNGTALLAGPASAEPMVVMEARNSLANRLNVELEAVALSTVEEVVFRDGCFDLPVEELCYPFPEAGFKILLLANGKTYEYRSDREGFAVTFAGEVE